MTSEAGNYKSDKKFAQSVCAEKNESKLKQIVSFCPFQSKPGEVSQPKLKLWLPEIWELFPTSIVFKTSPREVILP